MAVGMYERALAIRPDYWEALNDLVHALQHTCEWAAWRERFGVLQAELRLDQ